MSLTDRDRRVLFDRLEAVLGPAEAAVLMELLPPVGWSDVARRGDISELRGEMAELRGDGRVPRLRGEMAELRAEVHGLVPRMLVANLASMFGLAGLLIAAGAVF